MKPCMPWESLPVAGLALRPGPTSAEQGHGLVRAGDEAESSQPLQFPPVWHVPSLAETASGSHPYFERALERDPNNYYLVAHQGWHLLQLDDYAAAKAAFEKSIRLKWWDNYIAFTYLKIVEERLKEQKTNVNARQRRPTGEKGAFLPQRRLSSGWLNGKKAVSGAWLAAGNSLTLGFDRKYFPNYAFDNLF